MVAKKSLFLVLVLLAPNIGAMRVELKNLSGKSISVVETKKTLSVGLKGSKSEPGRFIGAISLEGRRFALSDTGTIIVTIHRVGEWLSLSACPKK